jgi:hypothetical protein
MSNTQTNERATLVTRLAEAETELGGLQAELDAFGERRDTNGIFLGAAPGSRHAEVLHTVPVVRCRVDGLREQLAALDKAENYRRQVAESPRKAAQALRTWRTKSQQAVELDSKAAILRERIALAQSENTASVDSVTNAETDAARAYAVAVSFGEQRAETTALEVLKKAQVASARAKAAAASNAFVIGALQSELTALEQQAMSTREEAEEHRRMAFEQHTIRLQAAWDAKASELATLGAKLLAASSLVGIAGGLSDVQIPGFSTYGYSHRDLIKLTDDVTDDSLVAEIKGVQK